ncbi:MAG: hypothetical protein Q9159_001147 [Coniocarpon cinnabarinum]
MPVWPFSSSSSSSQTPPAELKPPPNLNSPPGATIPNAPPSSQNLSTPSSTATTASQPQSQLQTAPILEDSQTAQYRRAFYYSSIGVATACPIIALMPPRKLDLFTFGLGIAFCMSSGYVLEQQTGKGLAWHIGSRIPSQGNAERRAREEAERRNREEGKPQLGQMVRENEERIAEDRRKKRDDRGFVKKVWMGRESDDWVQERKRREEEALDEGRGYGGLIVDYITEGLGLKSDHDDDDDNGNR